MRHTLRLFIAAFGLAAVAGTSSATAGISYRAVDRTVHEVISDLASILGVPISLSQAESTTRQQWEVSGELPQVIDAIASRFDLIYVFDGMGYRFLPRSQAKPRLIFVAPDRFERSVATIKAMFPKMSDGAVTFDRRNSIVIVRNAERVVSEIEDTLKRMPAAAEEERVVTVIRAGVSDANRPQAK